MPAKHDVQRKHHQKMTKFYKALAIVTATAFATGGTIGILALYGVFDAANLARVTVIAQIPSEISSGRRLSSHQHARHLDEYSGYTLPENMPVIANIGELECETSTVASTLVTSAVCDAYSQHYSSVDMAIVGSSSNPNQQGQCVFNSQQNEFTFYVTVGYSQCSETDKLCLCEPSATTSPPPAASSPPPSPLLPPTPLANVEEFEKKLEKHADTYLTANNVTDFAVSTESNSTHTHIFIDERGNGFNATNVEELCADTSFEENLQNTVHPDITVESVTQN